MVALFGVPTLRPPSFLWPLTNTSFPLLSHYFGNKFPRTTVGVARWMYNHLLIDRGMRRGSEPPARRLRQRVDSGRVAAASHPYPLFRTLFLAAGGSAFFAAAFFAAAFFAAAPFRAPAASRAGRAAAPVTSNCSDTPPVITFLSFR